MGSLTDRLGDLRIGDLTTFLAIRRAGSITAAARELSVTPSQVSKAVSRLEATLGVQLLSRGSRGVALSEAGLRALPNVEAAIARLLAVGRAHGETTEMTLAAPSFLLATCLPVIQACLPELAIRGLELPPALVRAYSAEDFFDMCLMQKTVARLPAAWSSVEVGHIRQALFASPGVARRLGPPPIGVERLRGVPFISPVYFADGQLVPTSDDCPLPRNERTLGHQVLTMLVALELAAQTEHVVFGPRVAAQRHLAAGSLVEVPVDGWHIRGPLYLACNGDRVLSRVRNAVADTVRDAIREVDAS